MNVFIIHSGSDKETVTKHLRKIKENSKKFNPLMLGDGGIFWKIDARKKLSIHS